MKLLSLTLRNFKGCRSLTIEPNGHDLSVYGDNATGKTTIADAIYWLLFGKDSTGRADFDVKTLDAAGNVIHRLEHSVRAEFDLGAEHVTMERTLSENWVKSRGKRDEEFQGNVTEFRWNGVPIQKTEFEKRIAAMLPADVFRQLTDPYDFAARLHWEKRREKLIEFFGNVTDADVIASNADLSELPAILGSHSVDECEKILESERRGLKSKLEQLPARIDEASRPLDAVLPAIPDTQPLVQALADAQDKLAAARADAGVASLKAERASLTTKRIDSINNLRAAGSEKWDRLAAAARSAAQKVADSEVECQRLEQLVRQQQQYLDQQRASLDVARNEAVMIKSREFTPVGIATDCPACGQALPADRVEAARSAAIAEWNEQQSKAISANMERGKAIKAQCEDIAQRIEVLEQNLANERASLETLKEASASAQAAVSAIEKPRENWSDHPAIVAIDKEIADIDNRIRLAGEGAEAALIPLQQAVTDAEGALRSAQAIAAQHDARKSQAARVLELEAEHKKAIEGLESAERGLWLIEVFTRTRAHLLSEKVNEHFETLKWRLFETQVNGGIRAVCEPLIHGVPFASANHGSQLNAGLEIIEVLGKVLGMAPPVIIDNAESVTHLRPTTAQQVRLIVSAADAKLRVETAQTAAKELQPA